MAEESYAFSCKGDVYIDVLTDAGASTGLQLRGECTKLAGKTQSERKEMIGRGLNTDGKVVASVVRAKPTQWSFAFQRVSATLFAMAVSGVSADFNQAAGDVADQLVTAKLGKFVELGKVNISSTGLTVKNEAGSTTYDLGTDYNINYRLGLFTAIEGGAISDAQKLKITYSHVATTGKEILGGKKYSLRCRVLMDGENLENGKKFFLDIPMIRLSTDSEVDFMKNDFLELAMSGTSEMAPGQENEFRMVFLD